MDFLKYCEEPIFFLKIYNSLSEDSRIKVEKTFDKCKKSFDDKHDNTLFNPSISFKDGMIHIKQYGFINEDIDLKEEMDGKVIISEDLLEDILEELNTSHGLYVCNTPQNVKNEYYYIIDHDNICEKIEKILS